MNIVVTGAGGFVGRALAEALLAEGVSSLVLMDTAFAEKTLKGPVTYVEGGLQDADIRAQILRGGVDVLYHLAAVPGGAAEANPALSKQVNLDATLALFEEAAALGSKPRIVFTSTIAVLGAPLPALVDDASPIVPAMTYGTHKAMMELALADMTRRNLVDSVSVRLPGIVARPLAPSGLKSAFMSNVFHALKAGESFVSPVSAAATFWLMSVRQCVQNLMYAGKMDSAKMPASKVVTLPALRCTMGELVAELASSAGVSESLVSYAPDADLEAHFGAQPPLQTPAADAAGFRHDGTLKQLVSSAFQSI